MFRTYLALAAALVFLATPAQAEVATGPVSLKKEVSIDADVVVLGDLFAGLSTEKAEVPVAYAPELGRSAVLDAAWLARVARKHGVAWRPASRFERATIERASTTIPREVVEAAVREELRQAEPDRMMEVRFDNRDVALQVPRNAGTDVAVRRFEYDARNGRFVAVVVAPASAPAARAKVFGKTFEVAEVPVLTRRLTRGEVIGNDDVQWLKVNADRLSGNVVLDTEQLVGMTPRRLLHAGVPVRSSDIEEPVVVARGSYVTIAVRTDYMTLTVRGRAVEDGSVGKPVRVMNIQSKKVVEAIVVDAGTVVVETPSATAVN